MCTKIWKQCCNKPYQKLTYSTPGYKKMTHNVCRCGEAINRCIDCYVKHAQECSKLKVMPAHYFEFFIWVKIKFKLNPLFAISWLFFKILLHNYLNYYFYLKLVKLRFFIVIMRLVHWVDLPDYVHERPIALLNEINISIKITNNIWSATI